MNTGCLPEINVQLWQSSRTCSRLEPRGWGCRLMDALNRHCCRKQPSCSLLPHGFPPLHWDERWEALGEIPQRRKQSGYGAIP